MFYTAPMIDLYWFMFIGFYVPSEILNLEYHDVSGKQLTESIDLTDQASVKAIGCAFVSRDVAELGISNFPW